MATLTGTLIKDTYDGLLKTTDNQALPLSGVEVIQDGLGNSSSLSLGQAGNGAEIGGNLSISGWADIDGDLNIDGGDLTTNLTSFNLLNSGVTTINAFGQATTVNMGIGTTNFNMSGSITTGSLNVADAIIHDGDTDTKIEFLANQIKTTTGGVLNINVVPTATTFYQNVFFDGNIYSTDGNISLTNGDIVTGGHIAINSGNAATSFSSNANNLIVGGADSGTHQGMTIASDSGATGNIFFADGITGDQQYRGLITYNHTNDTMYLGASATNKVTITSDGLSVLTGGKIFVNGAGNNGYLNSKGAVAVQVASIDNSRLFRGIDSSVQEVFYVQGTGDVYAKNNITSAGGSLITGYIGATSNVGISALSDLVFGTVTASTITEKMRIDTAGNVGIGDSPDTLLHIKGSAPSFKIESSDTSGSLNIPAGSINFFGGYSDSIEIASIRSIDASSGGVAGQLAFYTSEDPDTPTERMRIDSSGFVTIKNNAGTTNASLTLSNDDTGIDLNQSIGYLNFYSNDASTTSTGGVGGIAVKAETAFNTSRTPSYMAFYTHDDTANDGTTLGNVIERMRIDSSGNVGIGTQNPATALNIEGTGDSDSKIRVERLANGRVQVGYNYVSGNSADGLKFLTGTYGGSITERMRIKSDGDIKIQQGVLLGFSDFASGTTGVGLVGGGENLLIYTSGAERARITSGGYLKASNTGTYSSATALFHEIRTNSANSYIARFDNTTATNSGFAGINIRYTSLSPDANTNDFIYAEDSTAVRFRVYSDGDVWTSDAGTLLSDETLKRDITDASPKLDDIMKLRVRNYYWREDYHPNKQDKKLIGFIAQEFEEVFPNMVSEHTIKDAEYETIEHPAVEATYEIIEHAEELDEDGNVIKEAWTEKIELTPAQDAWTETTDVLISEEVRKKGIKEGKLIPILVKAMQEQQEIINQLEARIQTLENK